MKKLIVFFLLIHYQATSWGQIINTIAGIGIEGYSGDGALGTAAALNKPIGIGLDDSANLYIADTRNSRIRKVDRNGMITTIAGTGLPGNIGDGGLATAAQLFAPTDVAIDAEGNIFIADIKNNTVRKVNKNTGIITTVAGNGIDGYSGDGGLATAAALSSPHGIALDTSGNLYIADYNNSRIRKVHSSTGLITTVAGNGSIGYTGDGGLATAAELANPSGLCVANNGDVYIADTYNNRIRKVNNATGIITSIAGNGTYGFNGDGGLALDAVFSNPTDVTLDGNENLFIADLNNNRVRKISSITKIITTVAGTGVGFYSGDGGVATSACLYSPSDIAVDPLGNIYIADYGNTRIRKITTASSIVSQQKFESFFSIMPNPTLGLFSISGPSLIQHIVLFNALGQPIVQKSCNENIVHIDLSDQPNGLYFIKVNNALYKILKQ